MKWAKRTGWELSPNDLTEHLRCLRETGEDYLDLTESNPTRCGFSFSGDGLGAALDDARNLIYAPDPRGSRQAREAVCGYYKARGIHVRPDQVFLTASTSEAYSFLFRLLADPGDTVLFPRPSYPLFQFLGDLNDLAVGFYPLVYTDRWRIDTGGLATLGSPSLRAVVLVNPNNPTGSYVDPADLAAVNRFCREHDAAMICDEVFYDYRFEADRETGSLAANREVLTFALGGLSKALAMPQMKVSWIVVNGPLEDVKESLARLEVIADTYLSVGTPVQNALPAWLRRADDVQAEIKERLVVNMAALDARLARGNGVFRLAAEGGWYGVLHLPSACREEAFVLDLLREDRVYAHPGYFFDFDDEPFIVVSLLPTPKVFQAGIEKILKRANSS